jgi:polyisoprenoid-binding protein YceI
MLKTLLTLLVLSLPAAADLESWRIDPAHSAANFSVKHMMVSTVRGTFGKMSGTVQLDPKDLTKTVVDATIEVASITTNNERRDNHLRSADFFDVEKFPTMTFKSKSVRVAGAGKLKVTGDLTIHGVTKEVTWDVDGPTPELNAGRVIKRGASATTVIKRSEFGMVWNRAIEAGGVTVGDEVSITVDLELDKPGAAPPGSATK